MYSSISLTLSRLLGLSTALCFNSIYLLLRGILEPWHQKVLSRTVEVATNHSVDIQDSESGTKKSLRRGRGSCPVHLYSPNCREGCQIGFILEVVVHLPSEGNRPKSLISEPTASPSSVSSPISSPM